jgi:hypothetical protein
VLFLSILSTYFFLCAIDSPGKNRYWFGYPVMSTLGVYAHDAHVLSFSSTWLSSRNGCRLAIGVC